MKTLLTLTVIVTVVLGSLAGYVGGRILLPEFGLTAPSLGTWFAFTIVVSVILTPVRLLLGLLATATDR